MSLGLETDVGNPNFAGARNPDDLLWVQFSMKAMPNNFLSRPENQGRPIFQDEVWIEIRVPGNQLLTIERPKEHSDEFRFPRQWAFFQQTKGADGQEVGTPLTQWSLLTPARIQELRAQRFYTVEQIAFASDDQLKSLGMGPGMAPTAFRERAKMYLESAKGSAFAERQAADIKERDDKIAAMAKDIADMKAMINGAPEKKGK